jgi:DNA-binding NtrC family response regulator
VHSSLDKKIAIIIVDDDPLILNVLRINVERITEFETEIFCASSGDEGLAIIQELIEDKEYYIGLVISDFIMPKMLGTEFLLKADKIITGSKKIMLTGQADSEKVIALLCEMEMFRFIPKPWNPQLLIENVHKALVEFAYVKSLELKSKNI